MKEKQIGTWGEERAAAYLSQKGYRLISMGYRTRYGENDLIVADDDFLVFVEVKTRKSSDFARAREAVDHRKIGKIRRTAQLWLIQNETALQPRFDVIELYAPQGADTKTPQIWHLEDAFQ